MCLVQCDLYEGVNIREGSEERDCDESSRAQIQSWSDPLTLACNAYRTHSLTHTQVLQTLVPIKQDNNTLCRIY